MLTLEPNIAVGRIAADGALSITLSGAWTLRSGFPSAAPIAREIATRRPRSLVFDVRDLGAWDSALVTFLRHLDVLCASHQVAMRRDALPVGVQRLLALAEAVPEKPGVRRTAVRTPWIARLGTTALDLGAGSVSAVAFVGEVASATWQLMRRSARFRIGDLAVVMQECGVQALPIVTLISILVGMILAFVGAVQLTRFGAQIYVADLVAIAVVREMGCIMTGIIMAGRTGSGFAAQLGTMKVTQEIEALTTMGIAPMEFLVVPRVIALVLMMPLLCLFADFVGMLGGAFVGVTMLDVSLRSYYHETVAAVSLVNLFGGLFKATVYGALVALAGCLRGFQCGDSSSAVGDAATRAVVTAIVLVVVACGLFAFIFNVLGI